MVDLTKDRLRPSVEEGPAARRRRSDEPAVGVDGPRFRFHATLAEEYHEILNRR